MAWDGEGGGVMETPLCCGIRHGVYCVVAYTLYGGISLTVSNDSIATLIARLD